MCCMNAKCFRHVARSPCQSIIMFDLACSSQHYRNSAHWFERPDKNCMRRVFYVGHHIEQVMYTIAQVYICQSAIGVHDLVSCGSSSAKRMSSPVNHTFI